MSYVRELRSLVGHRPLIIVGATVLIFNEQNCMEIGESFFLLNRRGRRERRERFIGYVS